METELDPTQLLEVGSYQGEDSMLIKSEDPALMVVPYPGEDTAMTM
jgi:hypothetical protein